GEVAYRDPGFRHSLAAQPTRAVGTAARAYDGTVEPRQWLQERRARGLAIPQLGEPSLHLVSVRQSENCMRYNCAYRPPCASSSACVPLSTIAPASSTMMRSACSMVERRCAMTNVVRWRNSCSSAAWM